jgi:hypothetical protein
MVKRKKKKKKKKGCSATSGDVHAKEKTHTPSHYPKRRKKGQ